MKTIVITGPESSGKTTLLRALRSRLDATLIPEYARIFLNKKKINTQFHHILRMAQGQLELYEKAKEHSPELIIADTDLLVLYIWSKLKFPEFDFNKFHSWEKRPVDLYLLCEPDIPWEADELREDPDGRYKIFDLYKNTLSKAGKDYIVLSGTEQQRIEKAEEAINKL